MELSLLRFAAANPTWVPNTVQRSYLRSVDRAFHAYKDGRLHLNPDRYKGGEEQASLSSGQGSAGPSDLIQQLLDLHGVNIALVYTYSFPLHASFAAIEMS